MSDPRQATIDEAREKARKLAREITKQALGMGCSCYAEAWPAESCNTAEVTAASAISPAITAALLRARAQGMRGAADWLESNGQPGYAIKLRALADEIEKEIGT